MSKFNISTRDINSIHEELCSNARKFLLKRVTIKTKLEDLQRNLEEVYVTLKNIRIRIATESGNTNLKCINVTLRLLTYLGLFNYSGLDNCKERTRLRRIQTKQKKKADETIKLINNMSSCKVTQEHLETGKFPWYFTETFSNDEQQTSRTSN